MIPILFEHDETAFTSNGLGRLAEAVSCKVTEELNGIYELEMVYPVTGRHYDDLTIDRIIYATHDESGNPEPYDIYRKTEPIGGQVTYYARHISYRLNNIIVKPFDASSCTTLFGKLKTNSINSNPFTFLSTVSKTGAFESNRPMSIREILCGTGTMCVPQLYGGEYEWKKFTVYHRRRRGQDTNIELRYGKNLTDLTHDINAGQTYGAVIPYWLSNDGDQLATVTGWVVVKEGSTSTKVGLLDLSHEFDTYPEESDLITLAQQALEESILPVESLTVSFYELWQTEEYSQFTILQRAYLGDDVRVIDPELGINTKLRVVKTVYDCLMDRYDSMDLGKPPESFTAMLQQQVEEAILQVTPTKSAMEQAIEYATQLITGGLGGHLVIGTDANGAPNELLIMDTTDKATAVNVLRLNLNGIGFSTAGYNGPFTTAWTIDSHFVADFITTGNLNAALLTVGTIMGANGHNWFDLESDEIQLSLDKLTMVARNDETEEDDEISVGDAALRTMLQVDLFNKLTNDGAIRGIYMRDGQMFINFDYAEGGALKLGGVSDRRGVLKTYTYDELHQEETITGEWNSDGIELFQTYEEISEGVHELKSAKITGYGYAGGLAIPEYAGELYFYTTGSGNGSANLVGEHAVWINTKGNINAVRVFDDGTYIAEKLKIDGDLVLAALSGGSTSGYQLVLDTSDNQTVRRASGSSRRYKDVGREVSSVDIESAYNVNVYLAKYKDGYLAKGDQREGKVFPMFVAEQMHEHLPIAVDIKDGQVETWNPRVLVPIMFQMIKDQKKRIDDLEARIARLEALLA